MEHSLLCAYLYAAFSLRTAGEALGEAEAAAVARWRKAVLGVAVQEMGHLATVNNLMVALGGAAHFDRPNLPVPPGYLPAGFQVRLAPLDEATLEHFIFIESPAEAAVRESRSNPGPERTGGALDATPSTHDYETIAQLYADIRSELRLLAGGPQKRLFVEAASQVSAEETGISGVVVIRDLAAALAALDHIVDQGEGAAKNSQDSHFATFRSIEDEWAQLKAHNPGFAPAHPAARDPVMRRPAQDAGHVWVTAPQAAALLDYGNAIYGTLLTLLAQLYLPVTASEKRKLAAAAVELMHALSAAGSRLARLPASADSPGINAGLSFAVPRARGPRADAGILAERLDELAPLHDALLGGARNPVRAARARLA